MNSLPGTSLAVRKAARKDARWLVSLIDALADFEELKST